MMATHADVWPGMSTTRYREATTPQDTARMTAVGAMTPKRNAHCAKRRARLGGVANQHQPIPVSPKRGTATQKKPPNIVTNQEPGTDMAARIGTQVHNIMKVTMTSRSDHLTSFNPVATR